MRSRLHADLDRWELGELTLAELEARHRGRPVRGITALHAALSSLRTEQTPEPSHGHGWLAWLPGHGPGPARRRRARLQRPMVIAAALTVLSAGLALGLEPVRHGATSLFHGAVRVVAPGGLPGPVLTGTPSHPPFARPIRISGEEDRPVAWRPSVRHREGTQLSCLVADRPIHGRATVSADCAAGSYLPDRDFNGTDVFRYVARTEDGISVAAAVHVTVAAVNDPPVATDDTATTDEDVAVAIPAVANDRDPDGDSRPPARADLHHALRPGDLVIRSVSGALGTVDIAGQRLVYTPAPNFFGTDVFRYTVWDGNDGLDTASVRVVVVPVNDPPVIRELVVSGQEDTTFAWRPPVEDVDGDVLSCSVLEPPGHGQATVSADCSEGTYAPDPDRHGPDALVFRVTDGELSVEGKVTFNVQPVNDPPTVEDVAAVVEEDGPLLWSPTVQDVDGDELTCSIVEPPGHGQATVTADCSSGTYVPNPNFNGEDGFSYTVSDGTTKAEAAGKVTVSVLPVNDAPLTVPDASTTQEGVPVVIHVLANDSDVEGGSLALQAVGAPPFGTAAANPDGTVTYTPNPSFSGSDGFTYTVSDPEGATATGNVVVTVTPAPISIASSMGQQSDPSGGHRVAPGARPRWHRG